MLDKAAIYHKSARGAEAIATRNAALGPKQRSMLILINGKRSFEELDYLGQGLGDPQLLMTQLEEQGLIEPGLARAGAPSEPAPLFAASGPAPLGGLSRPAPLAPAPVPERASQPAVLSPTQIAVPLPEAQRFAVRRLHDLLGPTADELCLRIEHARTPQEFRAAIRRIETILREVVGPELAQQFTTEVESQRL